MTHTHRLRATAFAVALAPFMVPVAADADPATDFVASFETLLGTQLTPEDRTRLSTEVARTVDAGGAAEINEALPVLTSMAQLSHEASQAATRIVMEDLYRQLLETVLADPDASRAAAILDDRDPFVNEPFNGLGLSERDLKSAALLETLAVQLPADPAAAQIDPEFVRDVVNRLRKVYDAASPENRQIISRLDAWAAGVMHAWPGLSGDQRRTVAQFTFVDEIPAPALVEEVIGTRDLLMWLGGMDLALTDREQKAHPELAAYLGRGMMTGGMTEMIASSLGARGATGGGNAGATMMMQNLNYELLWDDLSGGSVAGRMMGLE